MNRIEEIYNGNFTKYGLDIILEVYTNSIMTSLHISVFGVSEVKDPYIYQIPHPFTPITVHRCIGFAKLDILVHQSGFIQIACGPGEQIGSDTFQSRGEVGLTFMNSIN